MLQKGLELRPLGFDEQYSRVSVMPYLPSERNSVTNVCGRWYFSVHRHIHSSPEI
jgi:hypothetical protein